LQKELTHLRQTLRAQPYYVSAELNAFNSWLTKTIRSPKTLEPPLFLKSENKRMKVSTWFKALITDQAIKTNEVAEQWKPQAKFFNSGNFRELRTELALLSLKAEGKIHDFHAANKVNAHDALGIDFWVELEPKGFFQRIFPVQVKSSFKAAKEFKNMHIHYSDHFREMMTRVDPQMVKDFDSMGFDGRSYRSIPVIIAKNKSISDIKAEILEIGRKLNSNKKLIHKPISSSNRTIDKPRVEDTGRIDTIRTLFTNNLLEPIVREPIAA
jgi:hypothetical protein